METGGMSGIGAEVWRSLAQNLPRGDQLTARLGLPELTLRLLCAIDSDQRRHFLIALQPDETAFADVQSRGLKAHTRELVVRGQDSARYLDVQCHDVAGYPIFDLIGTEIAQELAGGSHTAGEVVRRVLARWRRFWGQLPKSLLSRDEILGLFGEVWFLRVWLLTYRPPADAVQCWRGPFGARHDFEWPGKSIEVKATASARGRIHRINGIDQLLPPENGDLLVFSVRLREEAGAVNSLPTLIANTRLALESDADALGRFETGLVQLGYSLAHEEEYSKLHLRLVDEGLFSVSGDFPRIVPQSFVGGFPGAIERIEYEINLGAFDHLRVARTPAEAGSYLG